MIDYIAYLEIDGGIKELQFQTDGNPIEYLWGRYGMSTFIESVEEVEKENKDE